MCILSSPIPDVVTALEPTPARLLNPSTRQQLVLDVLAGQSITQLADHHHVSRKFIYQQLRQAQHALDQAFQAPAHGEAELLFGLPVTKPWLRQLVLGLTLICHSSLRGVQELLRDLFDYPLSLGSVHNILHQAVGTARRLNNQQDLAAVRIAAHDEIF
jgi:transposase